MKLKQWGRAWIPFWLTTAACLTAYSIYDPAFGLGGGVLAGLACLIGCGPCVGTMIIIWVGVPIMCMVALVQSMIWAQYIINAQ